MIDKKPFRVTNEQAFAVKNMVNGRAYIYAAGNDIPADWLASDLLDSRELIDKQEAIIKEMLALIEHIYVNIASGSIARKCEAILEKTKEYA